MNRFTGVGSLPRAGVVNGDEKKVLRFTLATPMGESRNPNKMQWAYVPCVVFKPSDKIITLLRDNWSGTLISVEGWVNTSKYKSKGETKYSTEVVVHEKCVRILQVNIEGSPDDASGPDL